MSDIVFFDVDGVQVSVSDEFLPLWGKDRIKGDSDNETSRPFSFLQQPGICYPLESGVDMGMYFVALNGVKYYFFGREFEALKQAIHELLLVTGVIKPTLWQRVIALFSSKKGGSE